MTGYSVLHIPRDSNRCSIGDPPMQFGRHNPLTKSLPQSRYRIATLILLIVTPVLSACSFKTGHAAGPRSVPNVVLILADDKYHQPSRFVRITNARGTNLHEICSLRFRHKLSNPVELRRINYTLLQTLSPGIGLYTSQEESWKGKAW